MKVFISHAMEADRPLAHRLANDLEEAGFGTWIAPDSIGPGEEWVSAINRGLRECDYLVLLVTSAATYSPWVNLEMGAAIALERDGRIGILPLQVEPSEIPPLWRAYQAIPFDEYTAGLGMLLQALTGQTPLDLRADLRVEPLRRYTLETGTYSLAFSPGDDIIAAGLRDGTIWRWNLASNSSEEMARAHPKTIHHLLFHPSGELLASASADQTVRLWSMPEGQLRHTLEGHLDSVRTLSFSPDGSMLASGSRDGTVRLWSMPDGDLVHVLRGHEKSVYGVAFSPDGSAVASVSSDNTVKLWTLSRTEGAEVGKLESTVLSVAFSPDGTLLATGTWAGHIRLWDMEGGTRGRLLEGHNDRVHRLVFSPSGSLLISSSKDTTIRLWNVPEEKRARPPLRLHSGWVRALALSSDGTLMISGDTDGFVRLWQVSTE